MERITTIRIDWDREEEKILGVGETHSLNSTELMDLKTDLVDFLDRLAKKRKSEEVEKYNRIL